jgi:uncharacterized SAM-dependent methyltransferase
LAFYNPDEGRVEIYIVSGQDLTVTIQDHEFRFHKGERIHTEYSHKYTINGFAAMAADVGLALHQSWTDERDYFAVLHFAVAH